MPSHDFTQRAIPHHSRWLRCGGRCIPAARRSTSFLLAAIIFSWTWIVEMSAHRGWTMRSIFKALVVILFILLSVSFEVAFAKTRLFRICPGTLAGGTCGTSEDFVIALSRKDQLLAADAIVSGKTTDQVHVQGMIVARPARYNAPWKFHLRPSTISFFTFAHPTCWGYSTSEINSNLDKLGSPDFLPTRFWCPRGYRLTEEVR
jgi:hypothetical protein